MLLKLGTLERRSDSEMARLLLNIGYCVATGNIEKAERIAGRLNT
jgi:tellurite resistance protein